MEHDLRDSSIQSTCELNICLNLLKIQNLIRADVKLQRHVLLPLHSPRQAFHPITHHSHLPLRSARRLVLDHPSFDMGQFTLLRYRLLFGNLRLSPSTEDLEPAYGRRPLLG